MKAQCTPVALVTGASRGIGRAVAIRLAADGFAVAGCARSVDQLEEVVRDVPGDAIVAYPADLRKADTSGALVDQVVARFGHIDVLVNAAGVSPVWARAQDTNLEDWDRIMETNLRAAFLICRAAGQQMIEQGRGSIVNVASIGGLVALPRLVAYCAAKGGLIAMTKVLAVEWGSCGVRVNAIAPGYVETSMTEGLVRNPQLLQGLVDSTPLGRLATPDEIAEIVCFVASDRSSFVTGAVVTVDGGWTAR